MFEDLKEYFEANKESWNECTPHHIGSAMYDMEGFRKGRNSLCSISMEALDEIEGKKILHLQCHFGQDTMSMARMGAKMTGLDFSEDAIFAARNLAKEMNLDVDFVCSNVYDAVANVDHDFDGVFLSYGALCWLPDMEKYGQVIDQCLKPGGKVYIIEFHPVIQMIEYEDGTMPYDYFNSGQASAWTSKETYTGDQTGERTTYYWQHSLAEILKPYIDMGYMIEHFSEHDWSPWNCYPNMHEISKGMYRYGPDKNPFPHVYALRARKTY
jgi:SAM-dependent methyltransferase